MYFALQRERLSERGAGRGPRRRDAGRGGGRSFYSCGRGSAGRRSATEGEEGERGFFLRDSPDGEHIERHSVLHSKRSSRTGLRPAPRRALCREQLAQQRCDGGGGHAGAGDSVARDAELLELGAGGGRERGAAVGGVDDVRDDV